MRAVPAGKRVRAEAGVHQGERSLHPWIGEIREIFGQLLRQQHAFVDERLVREARDIPRRRAFHRRSANFAVGALADHIKLALECKLVLDFRIPGDEDLLHERLARFCRVAEHRIAGRHRTPADHRLAFGLHDLLKALFDSPAHRRVARQKDNAAAVLAGIRHGDAVLLARVDEKPVRHLQQHAGAVAGVHLGAAGAAVIQVGQHFQALLQDPV